MRSGLPQLSPTERPRCPTCRERMDATYRLSKMKLTPQSTLDADPNLKLISERSPYLRTER